jgi:hypothetical protein
MTLGNMPPRCFQLALGWRFIVAMQHRTGRISRQVRRRLVAANGPLKFSEFVEWSYIGRRAWRWPIYRALKRWGEPAGRRGYWQANSELRKLLKP